MERIFLRRRIGTLFCIVGILTIISTLSFLILDPTEEVSGAISSDTVLIIDPGHGGEDGGAVAADGTLEAELNLAIAQKLNALASLCGVQTIMTRTGDHIDYLADAETISARKTADQKQRVALINNTPHGILISIHQNWYPTSGPHGAQVLYARNPESKAFGTVMHTKMIESLDPENRRVAAPISEDIYLMRNAACPAVLIECGFLSNPEELSRLKENAYQMKLGMLMLSAYCDTFQTGWKK